MQAASPAGGQWSRKHSGLGLPKTPAPSAIQAATVRNPAGKAWRRETLTVTKPTKRRCAVPKAASFIRLPLAAQVTFKAAQQKRE